MCAWGVGMAGQLSIVARTRHVGPQLRDKPLLVLSSDGPACAGNVGSAYEITFGDATRNIIVFGGTGRGKTESFMLPAAARMIANGCVGLILDAKGDFSFLAEQFADSTFVLGPGHDTPINLLAGMEVGAFRAVMEDVQGRYHAHEKYWGSTGVEDAVLVFLYVRETGREPTLKDIHDALAKPQEFCLRLERFLRGRDRLSQELLDQITARSQDEFGLLRLAGFNGEESESSKAREQYSWQTNALVKAMGVIVRNPSLRNAFCAAGSASVETLVFGQKKTLILDINVDQHPDATFTIGRMLRLQFMRAVTSTHNQRASRGDLGVQTFTFMLIDEYQQYVNAAVQQQADSLRDDNTWFDRSRSYGHVNIVATQSLSSLYAQVERAAADTIVQNCQNTVILPTTDPATLARAALLAGSDANGSLVRAELLNPGAHGKGFVHIANSNERRGGAIAGLMKVGTVVDQRHAYMKAYIGVSRLPSLPPADTAARDEVSNPYMGKRLPPTTGRIHVIVNLSHFVTRQWLSALTAHEKVRYVGIIDFIRQAALPWDRRDLYHGYPDDIQAGDLILIPNFNELRQSRMLESIHVVDLIDNISGTGCGLLLGPPSNKLIELERKMDRVLVSTGELITFTHALLEQREDSAA